MTQRIELPKGFEVFLRRNAGGGVVHASRKATSSSSKRPPSVCPRSTLHPARPAAERGRLPQEDCLSPALQPAYGLWRVWQRRQGHAARHHAAFFPTGDRVHSATLVSLYRRHWRWTFRAFGLSRRRGGKSDSGHATTSCMWIRSQPVLPMAIEFCACLRTSTKLSLGYG